MPLREKTEDKTSTTLPCLGCNHFRTEVDIGPHYIADQCISPELGTGLNGANRTASARKMRDSMCGPARRLFEKATAANIAESEVLRGPVREEFKDLHIATSPNHE